MSYDPHIVSKIYKSVVRSVVDLIDEINQLDLVEDDLVYRNFEERVNEANLPSATILGTDGFAFDENNGLWIVRYVIALSAHNDANLLNEIDILDLIHQRLGKNKKVPLREPIAGEEVSELVVSDFRIFPMGQSELRNYRTIGLELQRTGA